MVVVSVAVARSAAGLGGGGPGEIANEVFFLWSGEIEVGHGEHILFNYLVDPAAAAPPIQQTYVPVRP